MSKSGKNIHKYCVRLLFLLIMVITLTACKNGSKEPAPEPTQAGVNDNKATEAPIATEAPKATATEAPKPTEAPVVTEEPAATEAPKPTDEPVVTQDPYNDVITDVYEPFNIEVRIDTEYEYKYDETLGEFLSQYRYQNATLTDFDYERFPKLAEGLGQLKPRTEEDINGVLDDLAEAALSDGNYNTYFRNEYMMPLRADTNVVSILYSYEMYSGGVHSIYGYFGMNLNPVTGELYGIDDLIADRAAFVDFIYDRLTEIEPEYVSNSTEAEFKAGIDSMLLENIITLEVGYDYVGAVISPETIFPYSSGEIFVSVPFKGHESIFTDRVIYSAENYMVPLDNWSQIRGDFGDDGVADSLRIFPNYSEYEMFEQISIYMNNETDPIILTDIPGGSYGLDPVFVHANGKDLLYISYIHSSEDFETHIYEITGNSVEQIAGSDYEESDTDVPYTYNGIPDSFYQTVTYDPEEMLMEIRHDMIGTCYLIGTYAVDSDGTPFLADGYYLFTYGAELTLKKDLAMTIVDCIDYGRIGGEIVMQAGDILYLYGTDGAGIIDFKVYGDLEYVCRIVINVSDSEWPVYTMDDGSRFEEVFDGILYAD